MWRLPGHLWPPYACTQILIQAQRYTEYQKITIKTDAPDYRGGRLWAGVGTQLFPFNGNVPAQEEEEALKKLKKLTRLWKLRELQDSQVSSQSYISSNSSEWDGALQRELLANWRKQQGCTVAWSPVLGGGGLSVMQQSLNHPSSYSSLASCLRPTPANSLVHWARLEWSLFFGLWSVPYLGWIAVYSCLLGKSHAPWIF